MIAAGILAQADTLGSNLSYTGQTTLAPLGLAAILFLGVSMMLAPRRWAIWPMIAMACFIAPAQRVVIFSLNFDLLRIMVLFGWFRILLRNEIRGFVWNWLDITLILWATSGTIAYTLQYGTAAAFINRLGASYDAVGMYFLFRCLVRDRADIEQATVGFVVIGIPVTVAFLIEFATRHNVFASLGGVPEITDIRDGRLRCQGAFAHPILAGCFWASVMPLMAVLWWRGGQRRWLGVMGLVSSSLIIILCASSTPIVAVMCGMLGAAMFMLRQHMRWVRWSLVLLLGALQLVMKNPVWHLMARIDVIGGSTGWHRSNLITQTVNHFGEWWLVGTSSVAAWGVWAGDVTNQYILEGVRGGLLTMVLFIVVISLAFRQLGIMRRNAARDWHGEILIWSIGVSLFVHVMSFFSVSYFGQIWMVFFLNLAMIGSLYNARSSKSVTLNKRKSSGEPAKLRWQVGPNSCPVHRM